MRGAAALIGLTAALAVGSNAAASAKAEEERPWLPADAKEDMARAHAERLGEIAVPGTDAQRLERARKAVHRQIARVESWGEEGVVQRAPDLSRLDMPSSGDRLLDAMGRYQMCNAILFMRHLGRGRETDPAARLSAAEGLTGITLAVLYLGRPFFAKGTTAPVEGFLTGKPMEAVLDRVQDQADLREYADRQCRPLVSALTAE